MLVIFTAQLINDVLVPSITGQVSTNAGGSQALVGELRPTVGAVRCPSGVS
jgi:hypothetical protein